MKEYTLNGKVITATEKAYRVIYKEQGFLPIDEVAIKEEVVELPVEEEIKTNSEEKVEETPKTEEKVEEEIKTNSEEKVEETPKTEEKVEEEIETTEEPKKGRKPKKED